MGPLSLLTGNRGAGLLVFVGGLSAVAVGIALVASESSLNLFKSSQAAVAEWEANLGNRKALAIGGYLVAHNLVVCREDGWTDLGKDKRCRWGGEFHTPRISESKYNIIKVDYEDDALVLRFNNLEGERKYTTDLKFKLVDWSADSTFRDLVGNIPVYNELSDDDRYFVYMNANTEVLLDSGSEKSKVVSQGGGLRRPIGTPSLQQIAPTSGASCIFECTVGDVLTPNPECRGPLGTPAEGAETTSTVRVTNLGPGAIYKLKYERKTLYNQEIYPGRPEEKSGVEVLAGTEIFMPGEKMDVEVSRKCYSPVRVSQVQEVVNTVENTVTSAAGEAGTSVSSTSTTAVNVVTSFKRLSSESFDIHPSRFDPVQILDANFIKTYNPFDLTTYRVNPTLSFVEPKRLGTSLTTFEVSSPQETIVSTTTVNTTVNRTVVVRPVASEPAASDGDGDGSN